MAGRETICLLSWHSGMIIHFNDRTWDWFYEGTDTHTQLHTRAQEPSALTPSPIALLAHSSVKPKEAAHQARHQRQTGQEEVHSEKSAGNYGRRQFRSNQREIWGGLGRGLIGAGTQRCIHLSMRGLHQQSSPGSPNQSLSPHSSLLCLLPFHPLHYPSLSLSTYLPFPSCPTPQHFTLRFSQTVTWRATYKRQNR